MFNLDLEHALTVEEHARRKGNNKIWLCPHIVHNPRFNPVPILHGFECTLSTIPNPIKNKKVRKSWREDGFECIIWHNEDDNLVINYKSEGDSNGETYTSETD